MYIIGFVTSQHDYSITWAWVDGISYTLYARVPQNENNTLLSLGRVG